MLRLPWRHGTCEQGLAREWALRLPQDYPSGGAMARSHPEELQSAPLDCARAANEADAAVH
jgi:hypothetical protein